MDNDARIRIECDKAFVRVERLATYDFTVLSLGFLRIIIPHFFKFCKNFRRIFYSNSFQAFSESSITAVYRPLTHTPAKSMDPEPCVLWLETGLLQELP